MVKFQNSQCLSIMSFTYVSYLLSKLRTASVIHSCPLKISTHQHYPLKYYTSKTKEDKLDEISNNNLINRCKQFTTISKILQRGIDMSTGIYNNKISVMGLDSISLATVNALINQFITDNICLIDIDDDVLNGELLDLKMGALYNGNSKIVASKDLAATANSKICIIFTGKFRQKDGHPNMHAGSSVDILKVLVPTLVKHSPNVIIVVAGSPVDLLSYATWKLSGLPKNRIIGIGTMVDTARFRCILSQRSGISPTDCYGCIIGQQGENSVPVWSGVTIAGVPLASINAAIGTEKDTEAWNEVFKEAVTCDKTVKKLKGYNSWSCGLCIANLCRAILKNLNTVIPVSTYVKGTHGIREDVFLSLPCIIGANGVAKIVQESLSDEELFQLRQSAVNVCAEWVRREEMLLGTDLLHSTMVTIGGAREFHASCAMSGKKSGTKEKFFFPIKLGQHVPPQGSKVSVVGIGSVGMATVFSLITQGVTNNVALVDSLEDKLKGEVLDLHHGSKFLPNCKIEGSTDYSITTGSTVCVVTAGVRQRVGETRLQLVDKNTTLLKTIIPQLLKYSPDTIFLIANNPVDILTYVTWKISKVSINRVIGSGCNLDSSRFVYLLSQKFGVAPRSCHGYIIGEHGDSSVPVWSGVNIAGVRLADLHSSVGTENDSENWKEVHTKVVNGGLDVIRLKGYTSWAIGLSIAKIVRSVLDDDNTVQAVSTYVKGLHGIKQDVFLSLPCVIGRKGVLGIINQRLTDQERALLQRSAETIHEVQSGLKI